MPRAPDCTISTHTQIFWRGTNPTHHPAPTLRPWRRHCGSRIRLLGGRLRQKACSSWSILSFGAEIVPNKVTAAMPFTNLNISGFSDIRDIGSLYHQWPVDEVCRKSPTAPWRVNAVKWRTCCVIVFSNLNFTVFSSYHGGCCKIDG